ncbi:hypothetical protein [Oceanobacillus piezotolerans]|uniref:hypothetical protein n=1 Tax=Oceanobacillus piezotolerans TaxID=2448030 RepID=UPI00267EA8CD
MEMVCESEQLEDYLLELDEINFSNPIVQEKIEELFIPTQTELKKQKLLLSLFVMKYHILGIFKGNKLLVKHQMF